MTRADAKRTTFLEVFAVAEFRAVWGAEIISQVGDQIARVALAVLVYGRTNSAMLAGLAYASTLAPSFLGGVFLTGLADRFSRRSVMVIADLVRAVLIALVVIPGLPLWGLCVLVALVSFAQPPFKAAQLALLPEILPGDKFAVGMGIRTITMQTAQMIGFAGGGVLLTAVSPPVAMLLDAASFAASALLLSLGVRRRPPAARQAGAPAPGSYLRSTLAGGALIFRNAGLRTLLAVSWLSGLLIVYEGLAAPYGAELGLGSGAVGLILAADPCGSAIGAFIFTRFVPANRRSVWLGPLAIASCLPLIVCLARPGLIPSIMLFAVAGAFGTAIMIQSGVQFALLLPDHSRGQAIGLRESGLATIQGLGPLLAGAVADVIGTAHVVGLVGLLGLLIAVPAALALPRVVTFPTDIAPSPRTPVQEDADRA